MRKPKRPLNGSAGVRSRGSAGAELFYAFHRELNKPFPSAEGLVAHAISFVSKNLPIDRLSCFQLDRGERLLRLQLCLSDGKVQEIDEEIHLLPDSDLGRLADGQAGEIAYDDPHAVLFFPLKILVDGRDEVRGALRLERFKKAFSTNDRQLAARFSAELAQSLAQAERNHRNERQLKRLEALTELAGLFASSLRVEDGLKLILKGIQRHFGFDRVRLYLADRSAGKLRGEVSVDLKGQVRSLRGDEMALKRGEHRFVDLVLSGAVAPVIERYQPTVLHVPLAVQGSGIGLLVMDNLISQEPIEAENVGLLRSFAGQIALAIDNARLFDEVQALSLYDALTGLPVRRYFSQRFQEEIYRAQRSGQTLALAMMDIDHFKTINDTYGHQIGDAALQEVGKHLLSSLRKIDFPCRYGGDELVLLLPQAGEEEALRIMTRLAEGLRSIRVPVPFAKAKEIGITTSIGLALYPQDAQDGDELIQRADEALYHVKNKGRDGVAAFSRIKKAPAA